MRYLVKAAVAVATLLTVACTPAKKAAGPTPFERTAMDECYTVDLFTPADIIPPGADVPKPWAAFAGHWTGGAWDGKWCHELYILSVTAGGEADVIETHAPYEPWGKTATAFRRKAKLTPDGRLRMFYSGVRIEYWLHKGRLHGLRKEGGAEVRISLRPNLAA